MKFGDDRPAVPLHGISGHSLNLPLLKTSQSLRFLLCYHSCYCEYSIIIIIIIYLLNQHQTFMYSNAI